MSTGSSVSQRDSGATAQKRLTGRRSTTPTASLPAATRESQTAARSAWRSTNSASGPPAGLSISRLTSVKCGSLRPARTGGRALFSRCCQYPSEGMLKPRAVQYAWRLRPLARQALTCSRQCASRRALSFILVPSLRLESRSLRSRFTSGKVGRLDASFEAGLNPAECTCRMAAVVPLHPEQSEFEEHRVVRDRIAAFEHEVVRALRVRGLSVLGRHSRGESGQARACGTSTR